MATTYTDVVATSALSDALRAVYSTELEMTAGPNLVFDQFSEAKSEFAAQKGETVHWTIYRHIPPSINPLVETQDIDGGSAQTFQVSFSVNEYGYAIGTTEKLNLLSYHGPISDIVRGMLSPHMGLTLDTLCRNAFLGGSTFNSYGGTATTRATLYSGATMSESLIRLMAHNLAVRRVPLVANSYVCLCHPSVVYDIRNDALWLAADQYAGSTKIFTGEVGSLHGVRFIETQNAVLFNAGSQVAASTLASAATAGDITATFANASGFTANDFVTLYPATASLPLGTDAREEHVKIASIDSNVVTFASKLQQSHASGTKVRRGLDVFPTIFLGGEKAVGKGVVQAPEIRVALPTDKLRRINYVGWYALLGYGAIRPWAFQKLEVASSATATPAYPY